MNFPVNIIGVMSGTSLDGVDLAFVQFQPNYRYTLLKALTIEYPSNLFTLLQKSRSLNNEELIGLHQNWSKFVGQAINDHFIKQNLIPHYISSHGHTVFHEPAKKLTLQIGSLPILTQVTKCPVIGDFRSLDVSKGGQGAPLVPIGDLYLYPENSACLNLGGIANVTLKSSTNLQAFDICPCNLVTNYLVQELGMKYDKNGELGAAGEFSQELFDHLNALDHYQLQNKLSMGAELIEVAFLPLLKQSDLVIKDQLHTFYKHVAHQITKVIPKQDQQVLITGGGAFDAFLIKCLKQEGLKFELPDQNTISFKEAIVFAFLGLLKIQGKKNVLKTVTGASTDSVAGMVFNPT